MRVVDPNRAQNGSAVRRASLFREVETKHPLGDLCQTAPWGGIIFASPSKEDGPGHPIVPRAKAEVQTFVVNETDAFFPLGVTTRPGGTLAGFDLQRIGPA